MASDAQSRRRRLRRNLAIGGVGLLVAALGWMIDQSDRLVFMERLVAPDYAPAVSAYEAMLRTGEPLEPRDFGFAGISRLLGSDVIRVTATDPKLAFRSTDTRIYPAEVVTLDITFRDGRHERVDSAKDLRPLLRAELLDKRTFVWAALTFWLGVVMTVVALVLTYREDA